MKLIKLLNFLNLNYLIYFRFDLWFLKFKYSIKIENHKIIKFKDFLGFTYMQNIHGNLYHYIKECDRDGYKNDLRKCLGIVINVF